MTPRNEDVYLNKITNKKEIMNNTTLQDIISACEGSNISLEYELYSKKGIILIDAGTKEQMVINLLHILKENKEDKKLSDIIDRKILKVISSKENEFVLFNSIPVSGKKGLYITRPFSKFISYDMKKTFQNKEW